MAFFIHDIIPNHQYLGASWALLIYCAAGGAKTYTSFFEKQDHS